MPYQHDIFVSYRRDPETLSWIARLLKPIMVHRISLELGGYDEVKIYVHEITDQIAAGTAWPVELGETIGESKILVALWTGNYLASEWCRQELSLMLDRERKTKARSVKNKYGLVVPIVAHDGETIPAQLASAQKLEVKELFNPRMLENGHKAEILADRIAAHAKGIAQAIKAAPAWRKEWPIKAAKQLLKAFDARQRSQRNVPRFVRP